MRRIHLLTLGLAAAAAACGGPEPVEPRPQRGTLELSDAQIHGIAQVMGMEDRREYDPAVFDRLADGDEEVRRRTALAAGRIGDPAATPLLVRMLTDDASTEVRADAAFALGELGDTSRLVVESLREAVPQGWVPVRDRETDVVVEVIQALGKLGTYEARSLVVDALRDAHPGADRNARRVAAEALLSVWRFPSGPGRVNAVLRYLDVPDPELRWRAVYAVIRLGAAPESPGVRPVRAPVEAAPHLLRLLADPDHRVRANSARGLTPPMVDSAGVRDTAVAALTAALGDEHPHVRINGVRALAAYEQDAPAAAMAGLLADPDPNVAAAAAEALAGLASEAAPALAAVMADPERPAAVRAAAARSLAAVRPDSVAAQASEWAQGPYHLRYAAARTLTAVGWGAGAETLQALAADPDLRVAVAAVNAAGEMAADSTAPEGWRNDLGAVLNELVRDDRERVAIVALRGLESLLDDERLEALRAETGAVEEGDPAAAETRTVEFYEEVVRGYIAPVLAGERPPRAVLRTDAGEIVVELLAAEAPLTVRNFVTLARDGYWTDGVWHRVVPNFVLQDGAPAGDPDGGPGWTIRDEMNRVRYGRGTMGMALAGPDTGGSQWFITHSPQHHLDGGYTVFGRVIDGMDAADAVLQGDRIQTIEIVR